MKISASVKSSFRQHGVVVQTNGSAQEIAIGVKPSGYGSAVNGGEMLLLALATCFCNDLYREADKRNLKISSVEVTAEGEFAGDGETGSNFTYHTKVVSDAPVGAIEELIKHTDRIAEVHNTLRKGLDIKLKQL